MRQLRRNGIATKNWRRMWQHFTRRANSPSMARVKPRSQRECRLSWHFDVMAWSSSDASDSGKRGSFVVGKSKNSWAKTSFFTLCVQSVKKRCDLAVVVVFFFGVIPLMFFLQNPCAHTLMFSCTEKMYKNSTSFLQSLVTKSCTGTFSAIYWKFVTCFGTKLCFLFGQDEFMLFQSR